MPRPEEKSRDMFEGIRASLRAVFGTNEHARMSRDREFEAIVSKIDAVGESAERLKETIEEHQAQILVRPARSLEEALHQLVERRRGSGR